MENNSNSTPTPVMNFQGNINREQAERNRERAEQIATQLAIEQARREANNISRQLAELNLYDGGSKRKKHRRKTHRSHRKKTYRRKTYRRK